MTMGAGLQSQRVTTLLSCWRAWPTHGAGAVATSYILIHKAQPQRHSSSNKATLPNPSNPQIVLLSINIQTYEPMGVVLIQTSTPLSISRDIFVIKIEIPHIKWPCLFCSPSSL